MLFYFLFGVTLKTKNQITKFRTGLSMQQLFHLKTLLTVDEVPVSDEVDWSPILQLSYISKLE